MREGEIALTAKIHQCVQRRLRGANICFSLKSGKCIASSDICLFAQRTCKIVLPARRYRMRDLHLSRRHRASQMTSASFIERTNKLNNRAKKHSPIGLVERSKAGREVSIRSDFIANSNTSDKHSSMKSLIARENLPRKVRVYIGRERAEGRECRGGWKGLGQRRGDSLVVQHGSVWTTRIPDVFPPVRVCGAHVCLSCRIFGAEVGTWWASAPYYAQRGPLERTNRAFRGQSFVLGFKRHNILR